MRCKYYKEVNILIFVNSDKEESKFFQLCHNQKTMVIQTGGILLQMCIYNEENENECPYNK